MIVTFQAVKQISENRQNIMRKIIIKLINFYRSYKTQAYPGDQKNNFTRWLYLLSRGKVNLIYKAYLNTAFDWKQLDTETVNKLNNTMPSNPEGCLLDKVNDLRARTQISFLVSILKQINAKKMLEIGTHKAMFCYVVHLYDSSITIDTFGNLPESQKAVDILNSKFGEYIHYYLGNSRQTLKNFSPNYQIDFAWVDGSHYYEVLMSDLFNCDRLKILNIAVDDYKWSNDVKKAVDEFVEKYNYSITGISDLIDYRGIVHLTRN